MKKKNILLTLVCIVALSFCAHAQFGTALKNATSKAISEKVSIEKIPASLEEFQALQAELGTTPEGCIMMQLVAMEMYRRDRKVGLECLALTNTETNLSDMKRRLNELFRENDSYARPYLVSACFKGAKPSNGYNPDKPYTIQVRKDPNRQDERSQMLKGYVKHYQLYSEGYDTPWRSIDVVQQKGDEYYRVSNCPAILTQCKEVDFDATEDWKELE
jgi:hypothetical protein